jgi:hypothetical protein
MVYPTYPTTEEMAIYKSPYKIFDVKCYVRLDHPVFISPFHDHFDGTTLNESLWNKKKPTWGALTVAGSAITLGTTYEAISPAWICSQPNVAFPKNTTTDWLFETRLRFPTITGYGVFLRICSLENVDAVMAVKANLAEGVIVKAPDESSEGSPTLWSGGLTNNYFRVRVAYSAIAREYTISVDANDDGVYESGPYTVTAVGYRADYIVVGNSTARQGDLGGWTEIQVDYITVTGTSESYALPKWAGPMYLYDSIGYDQELWAPLPLVIRGSISVAKENITDTLSLDLLNYSYGYDPEDPQWHVYTDFSFANRPIIVKSRISDGRAWTNWRQIFTGTCDEKNIELRENGNCVLTLTARDRYRRRLDMTHLIRAYAKFDTEVDGLIRNLVVSDIIQDIAVEGCGLPDRAIDIVCTPHNLPTTFNIAAESGAAAITRLLRDAALCWYVDHSTGQVYVREWFWGTDTPKYRMSTSEEITDLSWMENGVDHLAIMELAISNTEFQGGGFATNFPHAPVPFFGRSTYESTVVVENTGALYGRGVHFLKWKVENRNVGGLSVRTIGQDWFQHDQEISVLDRKYLGLNESHGPWVVDGWTHEWEGTTRFSSTLQLAHQHPDRLIRDSLQGTP